MCMYKSYRTWHISSLFLNVLSCVFPLRVLILKLVQRSILVSIPIHTHYTLIEEFKTQRRETSDTVIAETGNHKKKRRNKNTSILREARKSLMKDLAKRNIDLEQDLVFSVKLHPFLSAKILLVGDHARDGR